MYYIYICCIYRTWKTNLIDNPPKHLGWLNKTAVFIGYTNISTTQLIPVGIVKNCPSTVEAWSTMYVFMYGLSIYFLPQKLTDVLDLYIHEISKQIFVFLCMVGLFVHFHPSSQSIPHPSRLCWPPVPSLSLSPGKIHMKCSSFKQYIKQKTC